MKFFALPFISPDTDLGAMFGGERPQRYYTRRDMEQYGDGAYGLYQRGRIDRDLAARITAAGITGSEFRDQGSLYDRYSGAGYESGYGDLVRGYGRGGFDPHVMRQREAQYMLANHLEHPGSEGFGGLYDRYWQPELARGGLSSLTSGINFGRGGHEQGALSFLSAMAGMGAPSFGRGSSILTQDCGFGGGRDGGHGLRGFSGIADLPGGGRGFF